MPTEFESSPTTSWSVATRIGVSIGLLAYLFVVVMGPMTNPISTEELTAPIGRAVRPIHQSLFLGHGYRFFAPNPGPSHRVLYRIYNVQNELVISGDFPNVTDNWPRVIYHRWFMLSETLFNELNQTPDQKNFDESQTQLSRQIDGFRQVGKFNIAASLQSIHDRNGRVYQKTLKRIDDLKNAIGQMLLARRGGHRIELYVQERRLPMPADVALGQPIYDERLLDKPIKIADIQTVDSELPR